MPAISRHCRARRRYSSALLATRHAYCPVDALDAKRRRQYLVQSKSRQLAMRGVSNSKTPPWGDRGGVSVLGTRRCPSLTAIEDAMSIGTKRHKRLIELLTGFAGLTIR